ncbi:MAG: FtsQ-type POTRA domain-containing protein [Gammaproteobacteria bacterium]|nr:FtsQ-type POTRA domain-containing protein [Gammaproteobacteria bacterium]
MLLAGSFYTINKLYMALELFPVEQVRIEGEFEYLDKTLIEKNIAGSTIGGFFDLDIASLRDELMKMQWVEAAFVRREWPDTVVIKIKEKKAVAKWGSAAVLTADGRLFYPPEISQVQALVELSGPDNRHEFVLSEFNKIQNLLVLADIKVMSLSQNERRSWQMKVEGISINLGRKNIYKKIESFAGVYASLIKPQVNKIKQIDFRYTNGFAVVWDTDLAENMRINNANVLNKSQIKADLTLMMETYRNV